MLPKFKSPTAPGLETGCGGSGEKREETTEKKRKIYLYWGKKRGDGCLIEVRLHL